MSMRWCLWAVLIAALNVAPNIAPSITAALAQDAYPSRLVKVIIPSAPGSTTDLLARLIADQLSQRWGKPVIVENISGAGMSIGAAQAFRAAPDGYTLFISPPSPVTFMKLLYRDLPFEPTQFTPISLLVRVPNALVVRKDLPAANIRELIAHAKANPGKVTYASAGAGSTLHLAAEFFKRSAGIDILHVPYKGAAQATTDLVGGQVQMMFGPTVAILPLAQAGKLRALAVTSLKRSKLAPELPTMVESGVPGFEISGWYGLAAPAGTPKPIIAKLNADTNRALQSPDLIEQFRIQGYETLGGTPDDMNALIRADVARWTQIIRDAGIEPQ